MYLALLNFAVKEKIRYYEEKYNPVLKYDIIFLGEKLCLKECYL